MGPRKCRFKTTIPWGQVKPYAAWAGRSVLTAAVAAVPVVPFLGWGRRAARPAAMLISLLAADGFLLIALVCSIALPMLAATIARRLPESGAAA